MGQLNTSTYSVPFGNAESTRPTKNNETAEQVCASHNSLAQSWTVPTGLTQPWLAIEILYFVEMHTVILKRFFSFKMQMPLPKLLSPSQFGKNTLWRIHPLILQYIEHNTFYSILLCFWENSSACLQLIKVIEKAI